MLVHKAQSALRRVKEQLHPDDRAFARCWPKISEVSGLLISPQQERWMFDAARGLPDLANIVEIGAFKGRSTCSFAFACRGTNKHVYSIDTFDGNDVDFEHRDFFDEYWQNVQRCGLIDHVTPCRGRSDELAETWDRPIDLLFIDGSHEYEDVLADFKNFFRHVICGGVVAIHDVDDRWPGVQRAWHDDIANQLTDVDYCRTIGFGRKPYASAT